MRALTTTATATALRTDSTTLDRESITFMSIVSMSLEKRFWHLVVVVVGTAARQAGVRQAGTHPRCFRRLALVLSGNGPGVTE